MKNLFCDFLYRDFSKNFGKKQKNVEKTRKCSDFFQKFSKKSIYKSQKKSHFFPKFFEKILYKKVKKKHPSRKINIKIQFSPKNQYKNLEKSGFRKLDLPIPTLGETTLKDPRPAVTESQKKM